MTKLNITHMRQGSFKIKHFELNNRRGNKKQDVKYTTDCGDEMKHKESNTGKGKGDEIQRHHQEGEGDYRVC